MGNKSGLIRQIIKLIIIGIISGVLLGALLKGIDIITGKKVYILLLNVDYIPIIGEIAMPEWVEFILHLIVSIGLVIVLYYCIEIVRLKNIVLVCTITCGVIGAGLYLTTALSTRTPELTDGISFIYWFISHILYGIIVGLMLKYITHRRNFK